MTEESKKRNFRRKFNQRLNSYMNETDSSDNAMGMGSDNAMGTGLNLEAESLGHESLDPEIYMRSSFSEISDMSFDELDLYDNDEDRYSEISAGENNYDDNNCPVEYGFNQKLAQWIEKNRVSREGSNELLSILRTEGLDVTKDSRTLLKTPRSVDNIISLDEGSSYKYLGIQVGVLEAIKHQNYENEEIDLIVNIDGLPLFKSTNAQPQLWPILGSIFRSEFVLPIAVFHGFSKPHSVDRFFKDFVAELNEWSGDTTIEFSLCQIIFKMYNWPYRPCC